MAGRNDAALAASLEAMAHAVENQPNTDGNAGSRSVATFQRENPPTFKSVVCFNCKEEGHIGSQCPKPKRAQSSGKVFALVED